VMRRVFAMGGHKLRQESCDAGKRWMIADVAGKLLRAWDEHGHTRRATYDALQRPTALFVEKDGVERMAERTIYGEGQPNAETSNLRGKVFQHFDGAGVVTNIVFDFKGNLLQSSRQLASEYKLAIDWSDGNAPSLEAEVFVAQTSYDALNRPTSLTSPDQSETRPTYNDAGLLEKVEARIRGAASWTTFVDDIDYDAKGQRGRIVYGNGTTTTYTYDPLTFRLTRLKTTRTSDGAVVQNLTYTYDPVGNIVAIYDSAQQSVFFNNDVVTPSAEYEYDAIYRLISASGREHAGGLADDIRGPDELPLNNLPHANDAQALRNYTERFEYDAVGNILAMIHEVGATPLWIRKYAYAADSNRLLATRMPGDPLEGPYTGTYDHDVHGNMTRMPHLPAIVWDENDQMHEVDLGGGGIAYYVYDAAGQRVRKVWEHSGLVEERIYLGVYEIYRKRDVTGLVLERETLHVMDEARRIALVETKTVDTSVPAFQPVTRVRYQLGNHLGSACLEVDEAGLVISYEEYHPYGTTSYWSARSGVEVSLKRYRYTGKERDDETGLYYHGARYYAPWLGRWTAADPAGMVDGSALYTYVRGNPVGLVDPNGTEAKTTYLGWSNAPAALARRQKFWGGNQYWSNDGPQGAGWYVKTDGSRILPPPPPKNARPLPMPSGEGKEFLSWNPSQPQQSEQPPPATPPPLNLDCCVQSLSATFDGWRKEWPDAEGKFTLQLPVKFTVELEPGVSKADCLIGQEKKGLRLWAADVTGGLEFGPDGKDGKPWWNGEDWTAADSIDGVRADWSGQTATFYDAPGWEQMPAVVSKGPGVDAKPILGPPVVIRSPGVARSSFPIYMGGGTQTDRFFQFRTYVADKKTNTRVKELTWGLRIAAETAAPEDLKYEKVEKIH